MRYKKYNGTDKYHFRIYKKSIGHPFIVVAVSETTDDNGEVVISGYMLTHSLLRVTEKPGAYERLNINPNPNDKRLSFVNTFRINNVPAEFFSKPYPKWHLSKEDELIIDNLEEHR
ncbi:MAG: hypothetical protein K6E21_00960 [Bacilli bacterium]|nr:hypothetical protein [Bacilli bacterium]